MSSYRRKLCVWLGMAFTVVVVCLGAPAVCRGSAPADQRGIPMSMPRTTAVHMEASSLTGIQSMAPVSVGSLLPSSSLAGTDPLIASHSSDSDQSYGRAPEFRSPDQSMTPVESAASAGGQTQPSDADDAAGGGRFTDKARMNVRACLHGRLNLRDRLHGPAFTPCVTPGEPRNRG
jgi:hypothetical protein